MKRVLLSFIVASGFALQLMPVSVSAQSNLQFSRVVLVTNSVQSVPAGRVWKIEGFAQNSDTFLNSAWGCGAINNFHHFFINGPRYSFPYVGAGGSSILAAGTSFPLWLPAGTTLRTDCAGDFLSVIEFMVIP